MPTGHASHWFGLILKILLVQTIKFAAEIFFFWSVWVKFVKKLSSKLSSDYRRENCQKLEEVKYENEKRQFNNDLAERDINSG